MFQWSLSWNGYAVLNEWGYNNRLVEQVINVGSIGSAATKVTEATEDMNSQVFETDSGETHELKEYDVNSKDSVKTP